MLRIFAMLNVLAMLSILLLMVVNFKYGLFRILFWFEIKVLPER